MRLLNGTVIAVGDAAILRYWDPMLVPHDEPITITKLTRSGYIHYRERNGRTSKVRSDLRPYFDSVEIVKP